MQIVNQRIRLAIDTSQMGSINDVLTGANPQFWNGVDLQIELGLFYGSTLVDVSNFDSITVDVKEAEPRTGLPIMSQTIASGSLNTGLTLNAWNGGAPADCHALAVFTNEETNLYLSDDSVTFWLVISALTNDSPGHKVVLGATPIVVQEGGEGVEPPASVVNPTYYTAAQSDARYSLTVDLTAINSHLTTLDSEVSAVTTTANAALPKAGGTMSGALTIAGLSGVLQATTGLISGSATTSALPEGLNLYFTNARAISAVNTIVGAASGICPLDANSLVPIANLPSIALMNTFVVASQAAMLALSSATVGDICIRTDLSETFILTAAPPATLGNWTQMLNPTSAVTSVNSLTGAVTLSTTNIAEGTNLYYTTARVNAAALATSLTGFSSAAGGTVTSGDTVLSALGKFEFRSALNDAKLTGSDRVKLDGSTAMTGMLNFSGSGNAGIQLSNLTDTQRAALTATDGMLIYNTTLSCLQYYNGGWATLAAGAAATWYNGSGAPASSLGNNGDYYINTANGSIYQKASGSWAVIYSYLSGSGGTVSGTLEVTGIFKVDNGPGTGGLAVINSSGTVTMQFNQHTRIAFTGGGTDPIFGQTTLNGTTAVSVSSTTVDINSTVLVFNTLGAGTVGSPYVAGLSVGTGFTIKSTAAGDTSQVAWIIMN
ncbi:MAG TPA: hypothetical protein VN048_05625 [Verrucomicrobiae bacterium]|jgi:hypothetical protein|nr:hypothetical protein [Verrucomicrobiae bacterium]